METKEELIQTVKEWVSIDNEISKLQRNIKEYKERKKNISTKLVATMRNNDIECLDLKDGQLLYKKSTTKKTISKKSLIQILNNYYQNNEEEASKMSQYILDNREEVTRESITRKIDKK